MCIILNNILFIASLNARISSIATCNKLVQPEQLNKENLMNTDQCGIKLFSGVTVFAVLALILLPAPVHAVPSFARQTGLVCSTCHTVFPELTPFGRSFKVRGYTMTNVTRGQTPGLEENYYPPVSAMLLMSMTNIAKRQPGTQNGNILFPDALSLFYAGRISDKLGAYAQITYTEPDDHFSVDNTDVRFANEASNIVYGLTFNNNPSVQDLWNSTPAWGFPFVSSSVAPVAAAATQIDATLAQKSAGLGAYVFWNELLYAELTGYRSSQVGGAQPPDSSSKNIIDGVAPYWRIAVEKNWGYHILEVGTYGLYDKVFPGGASSGAQLSGPTDNFTDYAFDAEYQYIADPHIVTVHSTWIHEKQDWNASFPLGLTANSSDTLETFKINGIYYYKRTIGGSLGYFATTGDADPILYAPTSVTGSSNGSPDTNGWIAEVNYLPWLNTKFIVQYTFYNKFNGGRSNYDGSGRRRSSDNNSLYVAAWFMF
jgi:hypothetical protein